MSIMEALGNLFSGGRDYDSNNPGRGGGPRTSLRPRMRPGSTSTGNSSDGGGDNKTDDERAKAKSFADLSRRQQQYLDANPIEPPKASELIFDSTPFGKSEKARFFSDVPYYSGQSLRPPDPNRKPGLQDFMNSYKNLYPSMAKDLTLGLGSLRGPEGFGDALSKMYGEELPQDVIDQAFKNFRQTSRDSQKRQEAESMGDGDDNFYGNYDPCPEGYRTDPVTGMCVPVMGMPSASAPAQYQGNFVDSPFPDLASSGPARMPFVAPMNYTQAMNYTSPTIAPSSMAAQGMGIAGIPMTPILG